MTTTDEMAGMPENGEQRDIAERLMLGSAASCTCGAKTPQPEWHEELCHYRLMNAAYETIVAMRERIAALTAPAAPREDVADRECPTCYGIGLIDANGDNITCPLCGGLPHRRPGAEGTEPVAYSLIFDDWYGVNADTTFKTREKAEGYVERVRLANSIPPVSTKPLPTIVPLYAKAPTGAGETQKGLIGACNMALWYIGQLETLVYDADDTEDHYAVQTIKAALAAAEPQDMGGR